MDKGFICTLSMCHGILPNFMLLHMVVKSILSLTKYPLESALQSSSPERKAFSRLKKGENFVWGTRKSASSVANCIKGEKFSFTIIPAGVRERKSGEKTF